MRAYETCFDQADEPPVETLHRLRIECKQSVTRYEQAQVKIIDELRHQTRADFGHFVGKQNRGHLLSALGNI